MKKGSYVVQEVYESSSTSGVKGGGAGGGGGVVYVPPPVHNRPDTSYSSCLLALLFFLALCIIIMLAAWPWNRAKEPHVPVEHETDEPPIHGGLHGSGTSSTTPHHHHEAEIDPPRTTTPHHPPTPRQPPSTHPPATMTTKPVTTTTTTKKPHPPPPGEADEDDHDGGDEKVDDGTGHTNRSHENPHHPYPGDGHHHHTETTTERWDSMRETTTQRHGYTKGGVKRRPSKGGVGPRIGGEQDYDDDAEQVNGTLPDSVTEASGRRMLDKMVLSVADRNDTAETTTTSVPETTTVPSVQTENEQTTSFGATTPLPPATVITPEDTDPDARVCQTKSCKFYAARMLALMDHSVEPCDDFYRYACGGMTAPGSDWISEEIEEANAWSRISDKLSKITDYSPMSHQKFKSFHDSCIFYGHKVSLEDRLQKARDVLTTVGRFYTDSEWKSKPGNLTTLIGNLLKNHFSPLFDIHLDVDAKSPKFAIKLTVPVFKSPFGDQDGVALNGWKSETCKQQAVEKPKNKEKVDLTKRYHQYVECSSKYEDYVNKEVTEAIEALNIIKYDDETVTQNLMSDIAIYTDLLLNETGLKVDPSPAEKRRALLAKDFRVYTIKDMEEKFPVVNWRYLIQMLLGQDLAEETEIQVYFEKFFLTFFDKLQNEIDDRRVNNALMAMYVHELYHGLVVNRSSCNRKGYCLSVVKELMDPIASSLFLQSYDPAQLSAFQSKIHSMFQEILMTLKLEISKLHWEDTNSQNLALEKLQNLKLVADGGVSVFMKESYLEAQYETVAANKTYLENAIDLMKRYRERMYAVYKKNPFEPEQIWSHFLLPFRDQGVVIRGLNSVVIPYGRMMKPFFSEDYPLYVQMSGLGFMIAHEIWHQFDTTGVKYDPKGQQDNKFSVGSIAAINKTVECVMEQAKATVTQVTDSGVEFSYSLNPELSLNERLVDIGGAHLAYETIWSSANLSASLEELPWTPMKPEQLFFLSLAQNFCTKSSAFDSAISLFEGEHLPKFMRVKDIVFNSKEFSKAFKCENPQKNMCLPFTVPNDK